MKGLIKHQLGITLMEALLVLAIAAAIMVLSMRQYQTYRIDADMNQLTYNVKVLAQAAARYYYANCDKGTLDPRNLPAGTTVYPLNITNDLITPQYLPQMVAQNPLVDSSGPGNGYSVQFNATTSNRTVCTQTSGGNCVASTPVGTIVQWTIQVSVLLKNPSIINMAQGKLNAECTSSANTNNSVESCLQAPSFFAICFTLRSMPFGLGNAAANSLGCPVGTNPASYNNYLVWTMAPSFVSKETQSPLWVTNPVVKQFKQLYTTYNLNDLTTGNHSPEYQYYLCGS